MATSSLVVHRGARLVERAELDAIPAPPATATWFPVAHSQVLHEVTGRLADAGFQIRKAQHALSRNDARYFGTLDLESVLVPGVSLAVGVRNSTDKSFPLGFCAGSRCFVCDNLAFRSELLVNRKHTRFGQVRFSEAICQAVQSLSAFRDTEAARIRRLQFAELTDDQADALLLRAYERKLISHQVLPRVIQEWRTPSFEEFEPRTRWSLLNAFTLALGPRQQGNPQLFASLTIQLQGLLDPELPVATAA